MEEKLSVSVLKGISYALELPEDIVFNMPRITMIGNVKAYIENAGELMKYTTEEIRFVHKYAVLKIQGESLRIEVFNKEETVLAGKIDQVQIRQRGQDHVD